MPTRPWDAITIGAGLGTLTAAAFLAREGKRVLMIERAHVPGGTATTRVRVGRRFEIAPLAGFGDPKGAIFKALGLYDRLEIVPRPVAQEIRGRLFGAPLAMPLGLDAVEAVLAQRWPDQRAALGAFFERLRQTQAAPRSHPDRSLEAVLDQIFDDHTPLKLLIASQMPGPVDDPCAVRWHDFARARGGIFAHGGGYLKGGSSALVRALADIVVENVGQLSLQGEATRLLTRGASVIGTEWRAADGCLYTARAPVVFAGIAPGALVGLLRPPQSTAIEQAYAGKRPSPSQFEVTYALTSPGADLGLRAYSTLVLPDWISQTQDLASARLILGTRPGAHMPPLLVTDYGPLSASPTDRLPAPVTVTGIDILDNWRGLGDAAYEARKTDWIQAITARLDAEWPGFAASVMRADMATARSVYDQFAPPGGAVYGFAPEMGEDAVTSNSPEVTTRLGGLYLASGYGAGCGGGGYTGAMLAGQMAAQIALAQLS